MTTAHRPTWHSALGGENQSGNKLQGGTKGVSVKDQRGHLTLKTRKPGQAGLDDVAKLNFKRELDEKEAQHFAKKRITERNYALPTETHDLAKLSEKVLKALPSCEQAFPDDADDDPNVDQL
eukprot:GHVU01049647.1.p1 GENE.GHVU01049647.1~~GHVU01049647.1.p1  ORF type:complete len:122 (-),score=25.65 GHVU01049647.1:1094-1459(-)